jgi:hypothetical protein
MAPGEEHDAPPADVLELERMVGEGTGAAGELSPEQRMEAHDPSVRYEYRIDPGIINMYRLLLGIGRLIAQETGQWNEKGFRFEEEGEIIEPDFTKLNDSEFNTFHALYDKMTGRNKLPPKNKVN